MLFDYLKLQGPLEEQARQFLDNTMRKGIQWAQDTIMIFVDFHKERVRKKELAAGTEETTALSLKLKLLLFVDQLLLQLLKLELRGYSIFLAML
jgi:hypothetical protein